MPGRLDELRADIKALGQGSLDAAGSLRARLHRLAGSGGSFGFGALSAIAQEAERWLMAHPAPVEIADPHMFGVEQVIVLGSVAAD